MTDSRKERLVHLGAEKSPRTGLLPVADFFRTDSGGQSLSLLTAITGRGRIPRDRLRFGIKDYEDRLCELTVPFPTQKGRIQ